MTVVADTSIWVDYLRHGTKGRSAVLDDLLVSGQILLCGPVVAELMAGTRAPHRARLWPLLAGLPWVELGRHQWRRVGEVAAELRAAGATVALTDIEIAVAAVDGRDELWTRDRDFRRIAAVLTELAFLAGRDRCPPPPALNPKVGAGGSRYSP